MSAKFEASIEQVESFTCYTLVDITNTGVNDPGKPLPYQQYQNLNTLIQCIGLRSQPLMLDIKRMENQPLSQYAFGKQYAEGKAHVWRMRWRCDRPGYFTIGLLKEDACGLPIYADLEESVELPTHVVETADTQLTNTYFELGY